ncbi:MAG: HAD family hydrolase [Acidisphaera sp.]|nr:HAD family hydrolase [Acidisphaera sp.]
MFLDRDGVLNAVVMRDGKPASPRRPEEFVLESGVEDALGRLHAAGLKLFVVTNQPDVSRGLMDDAALDAMHRTLRERLPIAEIACCRHDDAQGCACRKPKPGMLLDLATRWDLALAKSVMIGDQDRDMACGRAAGCATIQLARPYNSGAGAQHRVADLAAAVAIILQQLGSSIAA